MIEESLLIFWGVWVLLLLVAAFRVFGFSIARRRQDRLWRDGAGSQKPVALIIPVKGFELQATPRFFDAIFAQTYRDYRVIVCFESWDDPVAVWLREHLELGPHHPVWIHPDPASGLRAITLVCGGLAEDEGQKVHNQRAAFRDLSGRDAIIAFADADILCGPDWLARLVAPINRGTHELATTYRWLVPKRPTLPNQLATVINASITTQGGAEWSTVLWGGSMALTREVFDELDVPNLLSGSLNDDLRLSKAARATRRKIAFVRSLILPTPIDFTWRSFFEFVKRQYTQVKFFSPILYTGVNFVLALYVLGAASIVAALVYGYFFAWIPVAAAYVIDQFRALARQQVYLSLFRENGIRQKLFAASWLEHMLTPFWMFLHWLLLVSTWTQSRLTWAGVRYRILSKSKTRVLRRPATTPTLPAGAPGLALIGALHDQRRTTATQPIRPVRIPTEPVATFTVTGETAGLALSEAVVDVSSAEEPVSGTLTLAGDPATTEPTDTGERSAPEPVFHPPVAHPGAPSAILPLSTSFHERRARTPRRPCAKERGSLSAAEFALRKTRQIPPVFFPCPVPRISAPAAPFASPAIPARPTLDPSPGRVLSNVERTLRKTRFDRVRPRPESTAKEHPSAARLPAPLARLAAKTRLRGRCAAPRPLPSSKSPQGEVCAFAILRFLPVRSQASRRAGPGCHFHNGAYGKRSPARSSRALPAARVNGSVRARPVSHGPSARP